MTQAGDFNGVWHDFGRVMGNLTTNKLLLIVAQLSIVMK